MKRIHVVAGIIYGQDGRLLIAKRPDHLHKGGLWEFPGGKVDEGESAREALVRELREELAIDVVHCRPFTEIHHDYPDKQVFLDFWKVTTFNGQPHGNEGQPTKWVTLNQLCGYDFPEANEPVVTKLVDEAKSRPKSMQKLAVIHKGYLWAMAMALLLAAAYYFMDDTRGMSEQQKYNYWWLEGITPEPSKLLADQYTLGVLEAACAGVIPPTESRFPSLVDKVDGFLSKVQSLNISYACEAAHYKREMALLKKELEE
ncbi:8-oxo-dGTP diphosphatase MutT [Porticoccaceae bacterium LTM1]|nr:8-oxo-dGTP diphosphatase MutT [Porticoccaceae bacterium LTM1]